MPSEYIPREHSLVRYVQWAKLRKDADDNVLGVLGAAFKLRAGERDLSATWAEYFRDQSTDSVTSAVYAIRSSNLKPTPKSGFAVGNVGAITDTAQKHGHTVRVLHEPQDDNAGHTAIHRWPLNNEDLFDELADEVWNRVVMNKDVP